MELLTIFALLLAFCRGSEIDNSYQCHDLYEYDASVKGEVTSPFFHEREKYHDGLWCEYRIRAPAGNRIKITFKTFDVVPSGGCYQDQLVVYGKDKESVLGIFCGTELPNPIISNEGESEIRLLFRTDFMASGKGFRIEYESARNMKLCEDGYTQCWNRRCYHNSKKCDGKDDCGDGTDEENCGYPVIVPQECGNPAIAPNTVYTENDRMVGGQTAIPNSWPWQVSLQHTYSEPNGHFCGGTLINSQWVLTATHCVAGFSTPDGMKIHIGSHYKYKKTKYEQIRRASKIIAYPDLEFEKMRTYHPYHDLSLIKLNAPVEFNDGVQSACLPGFGWVVQPGWKCYATGWGETRGSGGADQLKQMEQVVESNTTCSHDPRIQICISKHNNSPCHGDSGGPLNCKLGDRWFVFGAASYVTTTNFMSGLCTGPGAKTVYANVVDKVNWIQTLVNKYS